MLTALAKMNFGPFLINWIKLFYISIESCSFSNGTTSSYFQIEHGVRQGDPLPPYLFIISVEMIANSIKKDKNIQGINIGSTEMKLIQYADITPAILKNTTGVINFLA